MADHLTQDDLAAIRAREARATPGPWTASSQGWVDRPPHASVNRQAFHCVEDAQFMAHAREDVRRLLAHVEHLTAALAESEQAREALEAAAIERYSVRSGVLWHRCRLCGDDRMRIHAIDHRITCVLLADQPPAPPAHDGEAP